MNRQAFLWGRRAAVDRAAVAALAAPPPAPESSERLSQSLDEMIERRVAFLTGYQDAAYAARYRALVDRVRAAEASKGRDGLAEAVARNYFKLLASKDEYEVARLYTDGRFEAKLREQFEGDFRLEFHLAPPLFAERDPATGRLKKRAYGTWMLRAFRLLAGLKRLRGTPFDLFGYSAERRAERQLARDYEARVEELLARLQPANHAAAVELARLPEQIRGFGHIKEQSTAAAKRREAELLDAWRRGVVPAMAAE
jgi:indolepyruvate ferredoxin oxidoreductase